MSSRSTSDRFLIYGLFHLNLSFSSIPAEHHEQVVDRCYWPLVDLIERRRLPLGLEFPALTLQRIQEIDPNLLAAIRKLWETGVCEVVGSGYAQIISPLIPAEVNLHNLRLGNVLYQEILGQVPDVAYVNEQAFSAGLVRLYREAGFRALVVEWNNTQKFNQFDENLQYSPQKARGPGGDTIDVIWNNSVAFQKFQRAAHGQLSFEEYFAYLEERAGGGTRRAFPIYGNDAEVFDYRPGTGSVAALARPAGAEFRRLEEILVEVSRRDGWRIVAPGKVPQLFPDRQALDLCTAEYPIPCKKQERYNVTRWAVSGRDDLHLNTQCYALYAELLRAGTPDGPDAGELRRLWGELCYLWGSDFRTHTLDERCIVFRNRMGAALDRARERVIRRPGGRSEASGVSFTNPSPLSLEGHVAEVSLRCPPGRAPGAFDLVSGGAPLPMQVEERTLYRDGTLRSARLLVELDIPGGGRLEAAFAARSTAAPGAEARLQRSPTGVGIQTPAVELALSEQRGGTVLSLSFPEISPHPMVGTLPHGYFDDISLAADFYTGHFILHTVEGRKLTDLSPARLDWPGNLDDYPIRIPVRCQVETEAGSVVKTYGVYRRRPQVDLAVDLRLQDLRVASFRLGIVTLHPEAFERAALRYSTVNGGEEIETFPLAGRRVGHDEPVSILVSARHCLGATEGWVSVGDGRREVAVLSPRPLLYSAPMVHYEESGERFFCRLSHSLAERDETSESYWRGHTRGSFTLLGHAGDLTRVRRLARAMLTGVIVHSGP